MNGNFLWSFIFAREIMRDKVPDDTVNRSAAISALGSTGNMVAPMIFAQEKTNDEQEKKNLQTALDTERTKQRIDVDKFVSNLDDILSSDRRSECIRELLQKFTSEELVLLRTSAETNNKQRVLIILKELSSGEKNLEERSLNVNKDDVSQSQ